MAVKVATGPASVLLQKIRYGNEVIAFERMPRATENRRILIKVHPDCRVQILAPISATDSEVADAVRKRARWVSAQLWDFRKSGNASRKEYVSGESHLYLGKRHLLKVWHAGDANEGVKLYRGRFDVHTHDKRPEYIKGLFESWYRTKAHEVFHQRLLAVSEQALWLRDIPQLQIRTMQKQWGSCSPSGRLTLNVHLVKAPRDCIDYVILHELCHLAEHNHSKRFYRLMAQVMPNWQTIKSQIDARAAVVLDD